MPVSGGDKVADGFHYAFSEGYGARASLNWTSATWPNVFKTELVRSGNTIDPGAQLIYENETLVIKYYYRSYASAPDITLYIDTDRNPYNGNNAGTITTETLSTTGSSISQNTNLWSVTGLAAETSYYVYAEVTTGTETRYTYLQYELELAAPPTITTQPSSQGNVCPGSTVEFSIEADNATGYQWQQSVIGGSSWSDLSDNTDPTITSTHNDQNLDADANCEASLPDYTADVTSTDNCDATLDATQNPTAGTTISGTTNTITLTVNEYVGISNTEKMGISIYPNPAKTALNIERNDALIQKLTISNVSGKQILQKQMLKRKR